tara:strand:+ start:985 stop:3114 length:2130 start_codon:yes stop_codon:yes gene_type:complete
MQQLQLYIGTERVELFKDETVSLTQTIQNVRDIKKIFTEFTKTFSVPASKTNNLIFKHYYNFNINNAFDARIKATASLELNGILFKEGKITLNGVDLKNNLAHTYRITFFGNTVNLKDVLGDNDLGSLSSLAADDLDYDYATVKSKMSAVGSNIITPLITHTDQLSYDSTQGSFAQGNLYYNASGAYASNGVEWNQLKYAIKLNAIISAIETQYEIEFSTDFFKNPNVLKFYNLYMWLHRKKGQVTPAAQVEIVWVTVSDFSIITDTPASISNFVTEENGIVTVNQLSNIVNTENILTITPTNLTTTYSIRVLENVNGQNQVVYMETDVTDVQTPVIPSDTILGAGSYTVQIASSVGIAFNQYGLQWEFKADYILAGIPIPISRVFRNNVTLTFNAVTVPFAILEQIPKIKIIDFLSGIFQMFNLTAYIDNGIIVVKTLDSYYNFVYNPSNINIDQYLDTSKSQVNVALPFKSVSFAYKGLGTFLTKQYNQLFNAGWGSESFSLNGDIFDAPSTDYKIEVPFEHMQFERLFNQSNGVSTTAQYGYFVDDNQESYIGSPLLFYGIFFETGDATPIAIHNITTVAEQTSYYIPSNSLSIGITSGSSRENINFGNELNEFLANEQGSEASTFTDTLFETEYKTYIQNVFNEKQRLTTVTAYLPYKIFSSLQLNDIIELGQNRYFINSVTTDLTTGKTKFELLNNFLPVPDPF